MVRAFAAAGMHVRARYELAATQAVAGEIKGTAVELDVTKPDEIQVLADHVYRGHGAAHLLCNNAPPKSKEPDMARITFIESDGTEHHVEADNDCTVMEAALDNDVPGIEAECGGAGACATCHVYIDQAWVAVSGEAGTSERELLELVEDRRDESRLSCQITIRPDFDGMIVRLPETQGF